MAITINRTGITLTNDTGTPASPAGDGTLLSAADRTALLDAIDDLFDGTRSATFTVGAVLAAEGFGTHTFSASGTGGNIIRLRNATAGTGNYARIEIGNDSGAGVGEFTVGSSTSAFGDPTPTNGMGVNVTGAGGLALWTTHASGTVRIGTNATERMRITDTGRVGIGVASPSSDCHVLSTADGVGSGGIRVSRADGSYFVLNMDDGGSSAYATLQAGDGISFRPIRINPSGGATHYGDGSVSAPSIAFVNDPDTGLYRSSSDDLRVAAGGSDALVILRASGVPSVRVESGAYGTGAVGGASLNVGRNNSGSGAAGTFGFNTRTFANFRYVWVDDAGNLRIHTGRPTEDNTTVPDTAGTVVGTQTSTRATKQAISAFLDAPGALALIQRTPLYRFRYREMDPDTEHVGIMAEESPAFTRYGGTTFDPVNAFGYTAAAIKALLARVETLEAALAAR